MAAAALKMLNLSTRTQALKVWLRMAKMEIDTNLKTLVRRFQAHFLCVLDQ